MRKKSGRGSSRHKGGVKTKVKSSSRKSTSSRLKSGINKTKKGIKRVTPSKETLYKATSAANTAYDIAEQTGALRMAEDTFLTPSQIENADAARHLYRNTSDVYNAYRQDTRVRGGKKRRTTRRRKSRRSKKRRTTRSRKSRRSKKRRTTRSRKSRRSKKRRTTRSRKSKSNGDMKYVQIPKNLLTF